MRNTLVRSSERRRWNGKNASSYQGSTERLEQTKEGGGDIRVKKTNEGGRNDRATNCKSLNHWEEEKNNKKRRGGGEFENCRVRLEGGKKLFAPGERGRYSCKVSVNSKR